MYLIYIKSVKMYSIMLLAVYEHSDLIASTHQSFGKNSSYPERSLDPQGP